MVQSHTFYPQAQPYIENFNLFNSTEEAWFWFMAALTAQQDGAQLRRDRGKQPRPCEPADILKIIERLHQKRALLMDHIRVLIHYGRRAVPPNPRRTLEEKPYLLWQQAMSQLEPVFRGKGLIA